MQVYTALLNFNFSAVAHKHTTVCVNLIHTFKSTACLCKSPLLFLEGFYSSEYSFLCILVASSRNWIHLFFFPFIWEVFYFSSYSVTMAMYCLSQWPLEMYTIYFSYLHRHIYRMHVCMYVKWMCTVSLSTLTQS